VQSILYSPDPEYSAVELYYDVPLQPEYQNVGDG